MTLPDPSYTFELVKERAAVRDAPFTCSSPCGEAIPAPIAARAVPR